MYNIKTDGLKSLNIKSSSKKVSLQLLSELRWVCSTQMHQTDKNTRGRRKKELCTLCFDLILCNTVLFGLITVDRENALTQCLTVK